MLTTVLVVVLVLFLLGGLPYGAYRLGGDDYGPYSGLGVLLVVLLVLVLLHNAGRF
jgi:Protein of unknown function (DUF3309)